MTHQEHALRLDEGSIPFSQQRTFAPSTVLTHLPQPAEEQEGAGATAVRLNQHFSAGPLGSFVCTSVPIQPPEERGPSFQAWQALSPKRAVLCCRSTWGPRDCPSPLVGRCGHTSPFLTSYRRDTDRDTPMLTAATCFSFVHKLETSSELSRFREALCYHTAGQRPNMGAKAQATEVGRAGAWQPRPHGSQGLGVSPGPPGPPACITQGKDATVPGQPVH